MSQQDKALLLKIHDKIKGLTAKPPTTFSAYDGSIPAKTEYQPTALPQPLPPLTKYNR